jgi:ribosomal protein S7
MTLIEAYAIKCGRAQGRLEIAHTTIKEALRHIEQRKPSLAYDALKALSDAMDEMEPL